MIRGAHKLVAVLALLLGLLGCDKGHPVKATSYGANPELPAPERTTLPTANFSNVKPWPPGILPTAPPNFVVTRYADRLDHPRWLYVLPNGDVLVAESATVPSPPHSVMDRLGGFMQRNSHVVQPSANRITLLRDADGDGVVDARTGFLTGLNQPLGMALVGTYLYVGNTDALVRFPYESGSTQITDKGQKVLDLPFAGYNNHWTRNVVANADGTKLYVTVGSGSNAGENGLASEVRRAAILEVNPDGSGERIFASGLRNPVGLAWEPTIGVLWTAVNERDMRGDDLVPDYLTRVRAGDFYGWPHAYWGHHADAQVQPPRPDLVAQALAPDYALGPHTASLGLVFYTAKQFPAHYRGGAFIGQHGSWNRRQLSGYKVIYLPFAGGVPSGPPEDFLTGFLRDASSGVVFGRPVGVAVDRTGALLVADDASNTIWRVAAAAGS